MPSLINTTTKNTPEIVNEDVVKTINGNDIKAYINLIRSLTDKLNNFTNRINSIKCLPIQNGISLLDVHIHVFAQYIHSLASIVFKRLNGLKLSDDKSVDILIETRVIIERIRPLEQKLNYQIDKLLRIAATSISNDSTNINTKLDKLNINDKNSGDEQDHEEEEDDYNELLAHRPQPNLIVGNKFNMQDDGDEDNDEYLAAVPKSDKKSKSKTNKKNESESESEGDNSTYKPPKIAPQMFKEESIRKSKLSERTKKTVLGSRILKEVTDEMTYRPEEVSSTGMTYAGKYTQQASADDRKQTEREDYEESNFVRLPMSRDDIKRTRRIKNRGVSNRFDDEFANVGKEFDILRDVTKIVKENRRPVSILDKQKSVNIGSKRSIDNTIRIESKKNLSGATSVDSFQRDVKRAKRAKSLRNKIRNKQNSANNE